MTWRRVLKAFPTVVLVVDIVIRVVAVVLVPAIGARARRWRG